MTGEQKGGTVVKIYNKKGWVLGMGEILLVCASMFKRGFRLLIGRLELC